jgi:hypothetical protein
MQRLQELTSWVKRRNALVAQKLVKVCVHAVNKTVDEKKGKMALQVCTAPAGTTGKYILQPRDDFFLAVIKKKASVQGLRVG